MKAVILRFTVIFKSFAGFYIFYFHVRYILFDCKNNCFLSLGVL